MSSNVVLTSSVRTNLLALQNTADAQARIQERLATGKKVNSALDNATNFYTASALTRRSSDLSSLLDGMSNGIKTLQAADNAMTSITKVVESMQANIRQARGDKSFKGQNFTIDSTTIGTSSVKNLSFSAGSVGTSAVNVAVNTATVSGTLNGGTFTAVDLAHAGSITVQSASLNGGAAVSVSLDATTGATATSTATAINTALDAAAGGANQSKVRATVASGKLVLTDTTGNNVTVADAAGNANGTAAQIGFGAGNLASTNGVVGAVKTVDQLVSDINGNTSLQGKVRASNDSGQLRIENLSTEDLSVVGATASAVNGGTGSSNTQTVGGNTVRKTLQSQFNDLRTQLDKLAADASFNGVNLLKGDKLKLSFNETGTSGIEIQAKDTKGAVRGISTDTNSLNVTESTADEFSSDANLDSRTDGLRDALTTLQVQSSSFGASLSTVQIRQDFTKTMINTLQAGADNLTLADQNEEGASLLALNTRQQLSQTALSLASQASQAVLRLFG